MPFEAHNLRRVGYGGAPTANGRSKSLWDYANTDTAAVGEAANYFNAAAAQLARGDVIVATWNIAAAPVMKQYVVTSATGATPVTVALQTTTAG